MPETGPTMTKERGILAWVWPDGRSLPVIAGADGEDPRTGDAPPADPPAEPPADPPADPPASDPPPTEEDEPPKDGDEPKGDDVEAMKVALKKANAEARDSRIALKTATERAEKAEAELAGRSDQVAKLTQEVLRMKVAREHQIPDDLAGRLVGDTEEALREDAKRLAAVIAPEGTKNPLGAGRGSQDPTDAPVAPIDRLKRAYAKPTS